MKNVIQEQLIFDFLAVMLIADGNSLASLVVPDQLLTALGDLAVPAKEFASVMFLNDSIPSVSSLAVLLADVTDPETAFFSNRKVSNGSVFNSAE